MSAVEDLYRDDDLGPEPFGDSGEECKFTVVDKAPFTASTPYWEEKLKTCKIVASHAEGAVLNQIVAELHGQNAVESGSAEYQRVRRFVSGNPNFFRVRRSNGLVFCSPTLELLDLIKRGIIQRPGERPQYTGSREFCESLLQTISYDRKNDEAINDRGSRLLEENLNEYLERINDLRLVLKSDYADPEYLTLPYKTRFNDPGRIKKQHAIMGKTLEKAAEEYDHAALLTLTTDPKKFSSIWEMWCGDPSDPRDTGINGNWNRFMSWLSAESRLGDRPDYVKVLEATEKGFPHIHAIVFLDEDQCREYDGMPWIESKDAISNYWGKYQGSIVDVQPLIYEEDLPDEYEKNEGWVRWDSDGDHGGDLGGEGSARGEGGQTAGQYLGKYLSAIYGGIRSAAGIGGDGAQVMTDGGRDLADDELEDDGKYADKAATWKVAMYWATRRKIRTESRDLRQAVEDDMNDEDNEERAALAEQIRENQYEFVGAYEYGEIPSHIRDGATPIDSLMQSLDDEIGDVDARAASDPPPGRTRMQRLRRRFPSSSWPLLEGLLGNQE